MQCVYRDDSPKDRARNRERKRVQKRIWCRASRALNSSWINKMRYFTHFMWKKSHQLQHYFKLYFITKHRNRVSSPMLLCFFFRFALIPCRFFIWYCCCCWCSCSFCVALCLFTELHIVLWKIHITTFLFYFIFLFFFHIFIMIENKTLFACSTIQRNCCCCCFRPNIWGLEVTNGR